MRRQPASGILISTVVSKRSAWRGSVSGGGAFEEALLPQPLAVAAREAHREG